MGKTESDNIPIEEIYKNIGLVMTNWRMLEDGLGEIFNRLIVCSLTGTTDTAGMRFDGRAISGRIFYANASLTSRLKLISDLVEIVIADTSLKAGWARLEEKTLLLYKSRNTLAHGYVVDNENESSIVATSHLSDELAHRNLNLQEVAECIEEIKQHSTDCTKMAIDIQKYLVNRD